MGAVWLVWSISFVWFKMNQNNQLTGDIDGRVAQQRRDGRRAHVPA